MTDAKLHELHEWMGISMNVNELWEMRKAKIFLSLVLAVIFSSCSDQEVRSTGEVDPENIFLDYKISGDEADPNITIVLQFKNGGPTGNALRLGSRSEVTLDGKPLRQDSSRMTGAYYEAILPAGDFQGTHRITFTGTNNKKYTEEFQFQPLSLITDLPATIKREDLELEFGGLEKTDIIRLILTDTTFENDGINRLDTVNNGRILVSRQELETLQPGPVHLEVYREYERPVRDATREGGRLAITYVLRREIFLED